MHFFALISLGSASLHLYDVFGVCQLFRDLFNVIANNRDTVRNGIEFEYFVTGIDRYRQETF